MKRFHGLEARVTDSVMSSKKSWQQKLEDSKDLPRVIKISGKMSKQWGKGTCVIPAPLEVDEIMRRVRKGKLLTINEIREVLARKHKATIGCPITTGIFAWIASHAAAEAAANGVKRITPYWRTLKSNGELNPKYPGGIQALRRKLTAEGHRIVQKGKRFLVQGYESRIATFATA